MFFATHYWMESLPWWAITLPIEALTSSLTFKVSVAKELRGQITVETKIEQFFFFSSVVLRVIASIDTRPTLTVRSQNCIREMAKE